jgi:CspA family cold shock protein
MGEMGIVREWHGEEGWDMEGFRVLHPGQQVDLTFDAHGQDGFPYRAIRVQVPGVPPAKAFEGNNPSDAYGSHVTLHFDQ